MNILFISAVFPYPLYSGGQIRVYNLLKRLSKIHTIYLYTFIRSDEEKKYVEKLSFCREIVTFHRGRAWQPQYVLSSILGKYPLLLTTYDNQEMCESIEQKISKQKIDLLHIEPGYVWPSIPKKLSIPLVISEHNIEHTVYEEYVRHSSLFILKPFMYRDVKKIKKWENKIWQEASHIVSVSSEDSSYISKTVPTSVSVVPNGVDEETFIFKPKEITRDTFTCLYVGNFRWVQNIDAVRYLLLSIWPSIIKKYPLAKLRIVGREFPKHLKSYLSSSIELLDQVENVTHEFHTSDILLAPIRVGGGTKYKILEGMASGIPVLTTYKGTEGLNIQDGEHCYICYQEGDWVKKISLVLDEPVQNKKIISTARKFIESHYTWKHISEELNTVWENTYKNYG